MTILLLLCVGAGFSRPAPRPAKAGLYTWLAEAFLLGAGVAFGLMFAESLLHIL